MPVVGFNVYAQPDDESTARAKINDAPVPSLDPRYLFAGLPSNTLYRFWGTAIDDAGLESDFSAMITASTLEYPVGSELSPTDQAAVDAIVAASMAESTPPGVVIAISGPRGRYMKAYGNTKASGGRPVTIDDHFRIASMTKSFTSTLVMRAIAAGLLTLDDVLETYVPGVPNGTTITIRHLLSMRSGIPDYNTKPAVGLYLVLRPTAPWDEQKTLFYIKGLTPLFTPGTGYSYSNSNFVLLGLILRAVTGTYIRDLIVGDLITPLDLTETTWDVGADGKGTAVVKAPAGGTAQWNPDFLGAAGAMTSTAGDLILWAQAMRDHTRVDSTVWAHWTDADSPSSDFYGYPAPFVEGTPAKFGYGLGLESTGTWFGHGGSWFGYDGWFAFEKNTGACIAVVENKQTSTKDGPVNLATYTTIFRQVGELLYPGSMTQPNYKTA